MTWQICHQRNTPVVELSPARLPGGSEFIDPESPRGRGACILTDFPPLLVLPESHAMPLPTAILPLLSRSLWLISMLNVALRRLNPCSTWSVYESRGDTVHA